MLILAFVFALIRVLQGAPTSPALDPETIQLDTSFLYRRSLTFGTRSTNDIVFSCLATIFTCTWTAIHPNIPGPTDCEWTKLKRRVITTIYALLTPELVTLWAMRQRLTAKQIADKYNNKFVSKSTSDCRSFRERALDSVHNWFNDAALPPPLEEDEARKWTITHGFFLLMGGFMLSERGVPLQALPYSTERDARRQGAEGLENLISRGAVYAPSITEDDIRDRSKGDTISKTVVVLQTTWFILQCIARWSKGLTVTELEVVTLGFALLNGITYGLWWNKPQGVGVPVYLEKRKLKAVEERGVKSEGSGASKLIGHKKEALTASNMPVLSKRSFLSRKLAHNRENHSAFEFWAFDVTFRLFGALLRPLTKMMSDSVIAEGALRVPMFYAAVTKDPAKPIIYPASSLIAVIFGSVHLIPSWFLRFPSLKETWLWRVSAIIITVEPLLVILGNLCSPYVRGIPQTLILIVGIPFIILALPLYIFARVILITLALTSLRALPSDAHLTIDWVSFIPHL